MLYRLNEPVKPDAIDPAQLQKLNEWLAEFSTKFFFATVATVDELARRLESDLSSVLDQWQSQPVAKAKAHQHRLKGIGMALAKAVSPPVVPHLAAMYALDLWKRGGGKGVSLFTVFQSVQPQEDVMTFRAHLPKTFYGSFGIPSSALPAPP
jgi:hypothetical protein